MIRGVEHRGVDYTRAYPERESLGGSLRTLWQPGDAFSVESFSTAIGTEAEAIEHPEYGSGLVWKFGSGRAKCKFTFYPNRSVANLYTETLLWFHDTDIGQIDSISIGRIEEGNYYDNRDYDVLSIRTPYDRSTTVEIYSDGTYAFIPLRSKARV